MKRAFLLQVLVVFLFHSSLFSYSSTVSNNVGGAYGKVSFQPEIFFQPGFKVVGNTSFNRYDQNGFFFGKAKIGGVLKESFSDRIVKLKAVANISSGVFSLNDLFVQIKFSPSFIIRLGQFKVPFLEVNEVSESKTQFIDKPFLAMLSYGRDRGFGVKGKILFLKLDYFAGIFNGEGTGQEININEKYLYTVRIGFSPLGFFDFKDPPDFQRRKLPAIRIGVGYAYNPVDSRSKFANKDIRYTGDLIVKYRGFSMVAAYAIANRLKVNSESTFKPFNQKGWFVQLGYIEPFFNKVELVFRYERYDNNDKEDGYVVTEVNGMRVKQWKVSDDAGRERYQFGANIYLNKHYLQLRTAYTIFNFLEGPVTDLNGDPLIGDSFAIQLQFGIF